MFKARNSMRGSAFLEPEWVAMHPTDYEAIRLLTDTVFRRRPVHWVPTAT
jgi:hypothetical protein